ncbi:filamentous hemagglutinin N-terminal domain-containing protein [Variovorax ureilyticus]|uniref:two-partner secretion domain-containing protein n=1 Tax=Variovorax ureilyticus TaxID=1836198 RepID=UPI003D66B5AD
MNKNLHRIVFNAARGIRMVVQETAKSTGKGASQATTSSGANVAPAMALVVALNATGAAAQIIGAPNVPGNQRPVVIAAPTGVPVANIQTPSAAGVSRNVYNRFDVQSNGLILNNSRTNTQTQLGGWVQANPFLATGPARVILNEINSGNPSQIRGYIEIAGQRAEVIVANPAGIYVDGAGFINASKATLTTGIPQLNAFGGLDGYRVSGGTISIDGKGLDLSQTEYAAIYARALQVNAGIWANDLKVVTGANDISVNNAATTPIAGSGPAPAFALDVAALGGMFANKIHLVGTEAGLGVRSAGNLGAGAGGLIVTAAGRLENIGTIEGARIELASAGDIDNRGGIIRQTGSAGLTLAAPMLSNTQGGVVGAEPLNTGSSGESGSTGGTAGGNTPGGGDASSGSTGAGASTGSGGAGTSGGATPMAVEPPAPGSITASGAIANDGGRIFAGGPITLQTPQINNAGGSLSAASMAVTGPVFSNAGGTLNVSNRFQATVGQFDNNGGTVNAGTVDIAATGDLFNVDGKIASGSGVALTVGGQLDNTRGVISADSALTTVAGVLTNIDGQMGAGHDLAVQAGSMTSSGSLRAGNDATVNVSGALVNDGSITAARHTTLTANTLTSGRAGTLGAGILDDGALASAGDLKVTATGALIANGTQLAAGDASLQGTSVDLSSGTTSAANIAITAIQGNVTTSGATVVTSGTLAITANAQSAQTLINQKGTLNAGQLDLNVANITNTQLGEIVQTGVGASTIATTGSIDNSGGRIASNGQDLTLRAVDIRNTDGKIEHAAVGTLAIETGSFDGAGGAITTNGALVVNAAGDFKQDGGTTSARQITIDAGALSNRGGKIVQTGSDATRITVVGAIDNSDGTLASNGGTAISASALDNSSATLAANSLEIDTRGGALTNAQGTIASTTTAALRTGALVNDAGLIHSGEAITIDTGGQAISNTNAAGYATGQGGITSGDTLTMTVGAVDNAGGFIGSREALVASTQAFSNTAGGIVLGQSTVSIDTNGGAYTNAGGQTQAVGDLDIAASSIQNKSGLIRSLATTTLNAGSVANTATQGTDQGIEGADVAINVGQLDNTQGAIRADGNAIIASGGSVNNTQGAISALGTLAIVDPNAANPGAKTLSMTNTGGTLSGGSVGNDGVGTGGVFLDAKGFSADGAVRSANDIGIALTQDITNNAELSANGSLTYTTTGNFTNNGKLIAGKTLTVAGNQIDNTVNAEMSGATTVVQAADTLTNRGLIDGLDTRINAGVVDNVGTGRIYGDSISIGAGTVNNLAEIADGQSVGATIAARSTLDIGAGSVNNRDGAYIFSAGDIYIGGALDENRFATGQGSALNNHSATIETLGDMNIAMAAVNNLDTHLRVEREPSSATTVSIVTMDGKTWDPADTWGDPSTRYVYHRDADGNVSFVGIGWSVLTTTVETDRDVAKDQAPSRLVAGGNINIDGHLVNRDSHVLAGGAIDAPGAENYATKGSVITTTAAVAVGYNPNRPGKPPEQPLYIGPNVDPQTIEIGAFQWEEHNNQSSDRSPESRKGASVAAGSGTGSVGGFVEVPANVGGIVKTNAKDAGASDAASGANGEATVPMVVRTSRPDTGIPTASLFRTVPGGRYLIETDPRFANYRNWLSSDYLLNAMGFDPNNVQKRLGDGFYEQKLIREQIAQLTGYRYLDGFQSDEEQYAALMNAGATFAKEYGLVPGIALSAAQMAQLTSDIVWLVEQTVTLSDGSTQQVLVPQVYVRVRSGDIDGSGALLSADRVRIDGGGQGTVTNTGTIAGRRLVSINADTIDNLGGRISGGNVALKAATDINNIGGTIDARDSLSLNAGRDINVRTTTQSHDGGANSSTNIDRVAGLYVTNPGGTLVASAGHDVNLIGAIVANQGKSSFTSIKAGNDINLGTVTESRTTSGASTQASMTSSQSRELGTSILTDGTTMLNAGRDLNARQATVDAGSGLLSVHADRDINITSGQSRDSGGYSAQWSDKGLTKKTDNKVSGEFANSTSVGSRFSGNVVSMTANNDITIEGSHISGTKGVLIDAGRNLTIVEGRDTRSSSVEFERKTSGVSGLGGLLAGLPSPVLPYSKTSGDGLATYSNTASASTITSSEGGVLLRGGGDVFLQGVQVDAAKDITVKGGNVTIQAATENRSVTTTTSSKKNGITANEVLWHDPSTGINAKKTAEATVQDTSLARSTLNGANVSITADDTLAMAGTTVNTAGKLSLSADTLILGTQASEHSTQETSQGRDLGYQKAKDKGTQDQTTEYNQLNAGSLEINANQIKAGLGARDSVEALAQQPGMNWVQQITSDPNLSGKIDWQRVEEAHRNWNSTQQGLTPEGAAIVTVVVAWATWGTATGVGQAAGQAAAVGAGEGVALSGGGAFLTGTGATISGVVGGAVTAGISALAGQATVSLINNQGDIGKTLDDLGSSSNVKNLLTAIVTGGVLGGLNMNPTGLPTTGGGADQFMTQLGNNMAAGAAKAVISTAINGEVSSRP